MLVKVITDKNEFKELKDGWNNLLSRSHSQSIYLTWEWLFTWWDIYADKTRNLHITCFFEENNLIAILPCVITDKKRWKFSFKTLEFLGTGEAEEDEVCSNYLDIIIDPAYESLKQDIGRYILGGFEKGLWNQLEVSNAANDSFIVAVIDQILKLKLACEVSAESSCAVIHLPDSWSEYMPTLSKKWRDQIKRGRKELEQKGVVKTVVVKAEPELQMALGLFIGLHQQKWESQGRKGLFDSLQFKRFHERVIRDFAKQGQVYFHEVYCSDYLVASSYMLKYKETCYFYLPAYDHSFEMKIGLGLIERSYDIERSIGEKVKYYDFYRAQEGSYKWHMAKERKDIVSYICAVRTNKYFLYSILRLAKRAVKKVIDICRGKKD